MGCFLPDEILDRQKVHQEELDEAKQKAAEKDSLGSKISEGFEGDNPASSIPDKSSPRPESEDKNSASDKLVVDGKASVLCVSMLYNVILMVQDLTSSLPVR